MGEIADILLHYSTVSMGVCDGVESDSVGDDEGCVWSVEVAGGR